jgi:hypothetical protein
LDASTDPGVAGRRSRFGPRCHGRLCEFVDVFAAVCAKLGRLTALILPRANTEMMNLFLEQLAQDFQGYFIILLVDQAGWHRAQGLQVPENIRLLPQPAHSPELNPAEQLGEELREKTLPNRSFPSLDLLIDQLCEGLKELAADEQRVRSMADFPYMQINTS